MPGDFGWIVSGAGSAEVNGLYIPNGIHDGKTLYVKEDDSAYTLQWSAYSRWEIWLGYMAMTMYYGAEGEEELPAEPWELGDLGLPPPPTLSEAWNDVAIDSPHGIEYTPSSDVFIGALKLTVLVSGTTNYQCAIYKDSDKSILATTVEEELRYSADPREEYSMLASPLTLTAGTKYYFVAWASSSSVKIGVESSPQDGYTLVTSNIYNSWPDPASFIATNEHYMIEVSGARQNTYKADIYLTYPMYVEKEYSADTLLSWPPFSIGYLSDVYIELNFNIDVYYYADTMLDWSDVTLGHWADVVLIWSPGVLVYWSDVYVESYTDKDVSYRADVASDWGPGLTGHWADVIMLTSNDDTYHADVVSFLISDYSYSADIYVEGSVGYYADMRLIVRAVDNLSAIIIVGESIRYFVIPDSKESRPSSVHWLIIDESKESEPSDANDIIIDYMDDLQAIIYVNNPTPSGGVSLG